MDECTAPRQPFRALARRLTPIDADGPARSIFRVTAMAPGGALSDRRVLRCEGSRPGGKKAKKKGPGNVRGPFLLVTGLRVAAAVTGAAAAQELPEPTHVRSPVGTAHEEQLTQHIP